MERIGKIKVPTLFIWGNQDLAIGRTAAELNKEYMMAPYQYIEIDGGHWLMEHNFEEIKEPIIKHLDKFSD